MKILSTPNTKLLDTYTIEHEPIASIDLMERAGVAITGFITSRWGVNTQITIFAGPGNNGGDSLAVARLLAHRGYQVSVYLFNIHQKLSPDCEVNKNRLLGLSGIELHEIVNSFSPPALTSAHLVIDGLFGSGLSRPLNGGFAAVVQYINVSGATVVSIDIPSGLMGEENTYNIKTNIVRANFTLSIQLPKLAFLFAENDEFVGEWHLLDIGLSEEGIRQTACDYELTELQDVKTLVKPRGKFTHKGHYGHALLIAGKAGMAGAAVLCAKGCLRSGVGLLTVHVPLRNNDITQISVPEAMVSTDNDDLCFTTPVDTGSYQAIGIGPGLGKYQATQEALLTQLTLIQCPLVLDADALNILSLRREALMTLPPDTIITPHPKELERLTGRCQDSYERLTKAYELAQETGVVIVLKGAYTVIITPQGKYYFNPTGNPGMAKGGSGDVLTGVLLALLAQGYDPVSAARLGVYAHGLAGDEAAKRYGTTGMTAGDIAASLPAAWQKLTE